MIAEALDRLIGLADKKILAKIEEFRRTTFLLNNGDVKTVNEFAPFDVSAVLGSIDGLCRHLKRHFDAKKSIVIVGSSGISVSGDVDGINDHRITATIPFYKADMPGSVMGYEEFLTFLDRNTGHINGLVGDEKRFTEDEFREAIKTIKFTKAEKLVVTDNGPIVDYSIEQGSTVETLNVKLPKILEVVLRYGVKEYEIPCRFKFTISPDREFGLLHIPRDGALDKYIDTAIKGVTAGLGDGWHIVEGV